MKTNKQYLIAKVGFLMALLVVVTTANTKVTYAAVTPGDGGGSLGAGGATLKNVICDPAKAATLKRMDSEGVDLHGTVGLTEDYLLNKNITYVTMGMGMNEMHGCGNYIAGQMPAGSFKNAILAQGCNATAASKCKGLLNQFEADNGRFDREAFASSKVAGSLLGYANLAQNTLKYEPVPVNMAYFFNDYLAKVPVIGERAYAQGVTYQSTLINKVLVIWKIFRNIAYALMSVIMLWVGFAIITRKKINAQTVVNVQYALPKIVIALVMIAFSYPIGALITSFSWTLWHSSDTIVKSLAGVAGGAGDILDAIKAMGGVGGTVTALSLLNAAVSGGGAALGLIAISNLVILIMFLFAYFKAMWIYVKMVMYTAAAPIVMALYSLPGNDEMLEKWFKQLLAYGAGIFGMKLVMDLTQVFAWTMLRDGFTVNTTGAGVAGFFKAASAIESGTLFAIWIIPVVLIAGFAYAQRVPNIVEEMLIEKKRK